MAGRSISDLEMRKLLREAYAQDPEKSFFAQLGPFMSDPAMPRDRENRFRIHPLWLCLGLFALLAVATFFFFSFAR
jgi:type VI protein secretion system component VasF